MNLSSIKVEHKLAEITNKVVPVLDEYLAEYNGIRVTLADEETLSAKFKKITNEFNKEINEFVDNSTTSYFSASAYSLTFNIKTRLTDDNGTIYASNRVYVGKIRDMILSYDFIAEDEIKRNDDILATTPEIIIEKRNEIKRLNDLILDVRSSVPSTFANMVGR